MQILYDVHAKPLKQNAKLAIIPQFFLKILEGCVIGLILSMNENTGKQKGVPRYAFLFGWVIS